VRELRNYVDGKWRQIDTSRGRDVWDPSTGDVIARVPISDRYQVEEAVAASAGSATEWRRTPPGERVQSLYRLKRLLEDHVEDLSRCITTEHGKVLAESRGEVRRAIDNIDMACGTPVHLQGVFAEDISAGIDEAMIRQPVGICVGIVPFNFPLMIPCWFLPYAIACGNPFILKASERTPLTAELLFDLLDSVGLPPGVVSLVHGDATTAELLIDHPEVRAVSFVGSTPAAHAVYARSAARGKRCQAQGGAKNSLVILPDAKLDVAASFAAESAFGNAGQRCLAGGSAVVVEAVADDFVEAVAHHARSLVVGSGLDPGVDLGPMISASSRERVETLVDAGVHEGAQLVVDGRGHDQEGFFVGATVLDSVDPTGTIGTTELFGPVIGISRVADLREAIEVVNASSYGNMACLFTSDGRSARQFRYEAQVGNVGINIGVAQPMASFPFSGWGDSFFGDLHAHGPHAVEFFTQTKVVVERWP
jgi:malonate-semialdehyde dehydrogenase (acetylating)/methylmalonate-semialdehyde dehydrogenase